MRASHVIPRLLVCFILLLPAAVWSADVSATWLGGTGNWSDPLQWDSNPNYPNNNSITYDATINAGTVALDRNITIEGLTLNGGSISSPSGSTFELTLNEGLNGTGGSVSACVLNLAAGSVSDLSKGVAISGFFNTTGEQTTVLNNFGTVVSDGNDIYANINNRVGALFELIADPDALFPQFLTDNFHNDGTFMISGDWSTLINQFTNTGTIAGDANSALDLRMGGSSWSSGTINVGKFSFFNQGFFLKSGATITANLVTWSDGNSGLFVEGNSTINATVEISGVAVLVVNTGATLTINGTLRQLFDSSQTHLDNATITSSKPLDLRAGTLSGSGTINASVSNNGVISPGGGANLISDSPGTLRINGNLSLLSDSKIVMEIGGLSQKTQYDHLGISGVVTLGGTLALEMINGFQMQLNGSQTFTLLDSGDIITGVFANVANEGRLVTKDGTASFQVNYGAGSAFDPDDIVLSDPQIVPEPASFLLLALGSVVVAITRYRRS